MGPTYAHNCFIQMASEVGLVGLLAFLWIMAKGFYQTLEIVREGMAMDHDLRTLAIGLLSGLFAYLVHSFFDTHFYSLQLSSYMWLMMGVLIAICRIITFTTVPGKLIGERYQK